jgi:hypothetical protein
MPKSAEEAQARLAAINQSEVEARAAQPVVAPQAPTRKPGGKRKASAGRWATLNAFHDTVARHLPPTEQAVWSHLFRWCRDGKVSVSTREIAAGCGIDKVTATRALAKLKAVGLVWVVKLSRHRGTASVYGLHQHPDQCVRTCVDGSGPRKPR